MSSSKGDVLNFVFQPIKLDDLQKVLPVAKHSKYELIRIQIIKRINEMPGDESFLLAPATKNGGLSPGAIKSFCTTINNALRTEGLPWHIVYAPIAKAFAVAPYRRKGKTRREYVSVDTGKFAEDSDVRLSQLLQATLKTFNITLKQLHERLTANSPGFNPGLVAIKRAMLHVGKDKFGLTISSIGRLLKSQNAHELYHSGMSDDVKKKISQLSSAMNGGK